MINALKPSSIPPFSLPIWLIFPAYVILIGYYHIFIYIGCISQHSLKLENYIELIQCWHYLGPRRKKFGKHCLFSYILLKFPFILNYIDTQIHMNVEVYDWRETQRLRWKFSGRANRIYEPPTWTEDYNFLTYTRAPFLTEQSMFIL